MPRAYRHFLKMIAKRQQTLQLVYCATCRWLEHVVASVALVLKRKEVANLFLFFYVSSSFSFHFLCLFYLSALVIKQRTSSGCTEITCTTSLCWSNCPELWGTELSSMFWKSKWIIFSLLWIEISKPIIQPAVVNFINSDWLQKSAHTCPLQVG